MPLRTELKELLSGFEKRMKFINVARCILDYKYPDNIKAMVSDRQILDNIIVATLVFIKDRTLGTEQSCSLNDIESFIEDLSVILPQGEQIDARILARYIVIDVLQNSGKLTEYLTFNSKTEQFEQMSVRLLNEEKGNYHLTDEAFDFLFRSKEIESELDYSVTRFRMKEYMRRDNYLDALDASRELVSRIRNMKLSMDDFLLRCRENIAKITVDQYENVISKVHSLLEQEYGELSEIQSEARKREKALIEARDSGVDGASLKNNLKALDEIIRNISLTLEEQKILINKKYSLSESYEMLIRDNFVIERFQRMSFQKDILSPLRHLDDKLGDAAKFLLFILGKPSLERSFSLESFYAPQGKLVNKETELGIDITVDEDDYEKLVEAKNARNKDIIWWLFEYAKGKEKFLVSEFVGSLDEERLARACEENALANIILALFGMQELDIEGWKNSDHLTVLPNGEFELSWCLEEIPQELISQRTIKIRRLDNRFKFVVKTDEKIKNYLMTDFEVEIDFDKDKEVAK